MTEGSSLFRIIQSILSPKVESLKRWLARVGKERIDEIENPELAMARMQDLCEKKGYPKEWIDKRRRGIAVRQDLTDEWKDRAAQPRVPSNILVLSHSKWVTFPFLDGSAQKHPHPNPPPSEGEGILFTHSV